VCVMAMLAWLALAPVVHADPAGLVARYELDALVGTTTPDSSGNGLNAVRVGAPAAIADGRFGGGFRFGGLKDAFAGDFAPLRPSVLTVAAWVRAGSAPGAVQYIVGQGADACSRASYALYTGGSADAPGLRFYVWNGSVSPLSAPAPNTMWDGAWHLVTGTYDGAAVRLYVDARQVGTGTAGTGPVVYGLADNRFVIGNYAGSLLDPPACGGNTSFAGDIDQVRVFNRALDAAEIQSLMDPPSSGGDPAPPLTQAPAPAARIRARLQMAWVVSRSAVKITSATLRGVPAGATVRLVCRPCRIKQTLTARGNTRTLVRLRNKRLRRGQAFTVTITKSGLVGRAITRKVKRYGRTRAAIERAARRPFTETVRCIPVGATTPARKC
jgi:Concanavalin A-like lectin/glucanases superfamily